MSQKSYNPTSPLPKIGETIIVEFEGEAEPCYVQAISDEHIEVLINPDQGDDEFYAELYLEDMNRSWFIV
jgi:hypothetical protein